MVIMASGIARGRVRTTTTTTELPNMAADGGHTLKKTQPPCIRLVRGKFELSNQDSAGGKNSSVLTSS